MKVEVEKFPNGNLKVVVRFEPNSNFWKTDLTWCPSLKEVELLVQTLVSIDTMNELLRKYRRENRYGEYS